MAFRFLDLPPEIRERIYLLLCTSTTPIPLYPAGNAEAVYHYTNNGGTCEDPPLHPLFPLSLLLSCHQLYHEARALYFSANSFSLRIRRSSLLFEYFLAPVFRDNRLRIRSFRLILVRWGKNDLFVKTLAPLLQDMILNGNLRELEVRARRSHLLQYNPVDGTTDFIANEAVKNLRRILEDPYLERVIVRAYQPTYWDEGDCINDPEVYEDVSHMFKRRSNLIGR